MRLLYSFLFYLAVPFLIARLYWRSLRLAAYRHRIRERFGFYPFRLSGCIWVHAVSVGETIAAIPLIRSLLKAYPDLPLLVTTTTPTGAERVISNFGQTIHHVYLPYDLPDANRRFLTRMQPKIAIIMETELWPNLIAACKSRAIPTCLLNARLSEQSAEGYRKIPSITQQMLTNLTMIAANSQADAQRFISLGAKPEKIFVTGNMKYDIQVPEDISIKAAEFKQDNTHRFIWVAASTHEGEEAILLKAHKRLLERHPQALLILVPRHPDRFESIATLCGQAGFKVGRRSQREAMDDCQIYLGDTMGELLLFYQAADVAFVGGSLIARGGHNILEPAALGKPIISGKHLFNFAEISQQFLQAEALSLVEDELSLAQCLISLSEDESQIHAYGLRAKQVVEKNRGVLQKQLNLVFALL